MSTPDKIKEIAAKYSVSERTARRYLKRGQLPLPPESRCLGMDGKQYPRDRPRNLSPLHKPLAIARANIRRAVRAGEFPGWRSAYPPRHCTGGYESIGKLGERDTWALIPPVKNKN